MIFPIFRISLLSFFSDNSLNFSTLQFKSCACMHACVLIMAHTIWRLRCMTLLPSSDGNKVPVICSVISNPSWFYSGCNFGFTNFCKVSCFCFVQWNIVQVVKNFNMHHWTQTSSVFENTVVLSCFPGFAIFLDVNTRPCAPWKSSKI